MVPILSSRRWYYRLSRIAVLSFFAWWFLTQTDAGWRTLTYLQSMTATAETTGNAWTKTDFSKTSVDMTEILSGGPPKDGIPAVDRPKFISNDEAGRWLHPQEPVIVVELQGQARAYPLQILIFHEIVNDTFGTTPIAVTFCPLCNASMVFDRRVQGRVLDFGTTGKLRNSDMVMYDRQTESWWQQFTGEAIVGSYTGTKLKPISSKIAAFSAFQRSFPDGRVLSRNTGHLRYLLKYGKNPYRGYDKVGQHPFLFQGSTDPRLQAMERVVNVSIKGRHRIYPLNIFKKTGVLNDTMAGVPIVIFHRDGLLSVLDKRDIRKSRTIASALVYRRQLGQMTLRFQYRNKKITDLQTGSEWSLFGKAIQGPLKGKQLSSVASGNHFAFAWLAFHPDSEVYGVVRKPRRR